jgi:hypothetical protein
MASLENNSTSDAQLLGHEVRNWQISDEPLDWANVGNRIGSRRSGGKLYRS